MRRQEWGYVKNTLPLAALKRKWVKGDWTYSTQAKVCLGRLLIKVTGRKILPDLYSSSFEHPARAGPGSLRGMPLCRCHAGIPLAVRYEKWISPEGTSRCCKCEELYCCRQCGPEMKLTFERLNDSTSDGFPTSERIVDAGPIHWLSKRYVSPTDAGHPAYIVPNEVIAKRSFPPKDVFFRLESDLFLEFDAGLRSGLKIRYVRLQRGVSGWLGRLRTNSTHA